MTEEQYIKAKKLALSGTIPVAQYSALVMLMHFIPPEPENRKFIDDVFECMDEVGKKMTGGKHE